ncbi:hypothetical protein [Aeromonas phage 4L372XY]|uniref:Uncharacterized protein n=1 Tax=Aeromonas phage 4L372XY TaxID=2588520 RepID=A0A5B9N5G9_9CAUD|nr:hypothetical protein HWC28_gp014 [Aeromonas phage 4L372XY]QEG08729.1 hypothetical protein [Aeromonas phage 4L372XY]
MKNQINHLVLSWSVSKGRDTYGYNICRLDDRNNGKRFRCIGGGYDMIGTVFGEWLQENYQEKLQEIKARSHYITDENGTVSNPRSDSLYGMRWKTDNTVSLDGACGIESMIRIAEAIGLEVERDYIKKGKRRGETVGWYVQLKD